jgi:hypothetical protein
MFNAFRLLLTACNSGSHYSSEAESAVQMAVTMSRKKMVAYTLETYASI